MSFSADQFMQVKCRFQLCSDSDSFESIYTNNERIRLCDSVSVDASSVLIVMICSNNSGNNHIVAYYKERPLVPSQNALDTCASQSPSKPAHKALNLTLSSLIDQNCEKSSLTPAKPNTDLHGSAKARIIVKQIYYHNYNEDIESLCFSADGTKLILINAASTIYILPIKNILLNSHAKQLKSSQAKSMYFYDATILHCCTLANPTAIACWTSGADESSSTIIVSNNVGQLQFIDVNQKQVTSDSYINERIMGIKVIRDMYSHSLLITCDSLRQYRLTLEIKNQKQSLNEQSKSDFVCIEKDLDVHVDKKPIPIRFNSANSLIRDSAARVLTRVLSSSRRNAARSSLFSTSNLKESSTSLMMHDETSDLVVVIDMAPRQSKPRPINSLSMEPRFLHFYDSRRFYYASHNPVLVCGLSFLNSDELIYHVVLTDRLIAVATSHDRCLISSRNCCNLKNSSSFIDLDPLVKEITFSSEEKILKLLKSPVSNDQDGIIDSFLLVTNRSIYSIEARQSCRDMFINLIDTHLNIRPQASNQMDPDCPFNMTTAAHGTFRFNPTNVDPETNLIVKSFLCQRDEVYERITYDGAAFSTLFKLELNSLYEAYGDKLLLRYQFELAKRFFQMAKFDRPRLIEKFIRLAAQKERVSELCFLEYITLPEVVQELVKDVNLCNELMGPSQTIGSHGKYTIATLRHLDFFKRLANYQQPSADSSKFSQQQRQAIESIFITFLEAAVDNSTDDSRWIWFNYIKFYLHNIGNREELESDILRLLDSNRIDCRYVVAFYMAFCEDYSDAESLQFMKGLFENEFLLRLLEKSLSNLQDDTVYSENFLDFSMRCCA